MYTVYNIYIYIYIQYITYAFLQSDSEKDEWVEKDAEASVQEAAESKPSASTQVDF